MSEVKRYLIQKTPIGTMMKPNAEGDWVDFKDFDRVTAERDSAIVHNRFLMGLCVQRLNLINELQQRVAAADERVDVLENALRKIKMRLDSYAEADMRMPEPSVEVCQAIADVALKPADGASLIQGMWTNPAEGGGDAPAETRTTDLKG